MRVIIQRLWFEPAAVIGVATSIALYFIIGGIHSEADLASVIAPALAGLGIRQTVSPVRKLNIPEDIGDGEAGANHE
jgi:hypothetical protein